MIIKRQFPFYFIFFKRCIWCQNIVVGSYSLGAAAQRLIELDEVKDRCEGLVINQYVSQSHHRSQSNSSARISEV